MNKTDIINFMALANDLCHVLLAHPELINEVSNQTHSNDAANWQTFLKEHAVPDALCAETYKWHNVRIAMYIKAMEDSTVRLLHYSDRSGQSAPKFYQQLNEIFGYNINRHSVESQINHFHENDKNQHVYLTHILPLAKREAQKITDIS